MRRFLIKHDSGIIEGIRFVDNRMVVHGGVFHRVYVDTMEELKRMFAGTVIEWIDKEEWQ